MIRSRTQRTKEIFLRCSDTASPEREQILNDECGDDPELRAAVESLLRGSETIPEDFLEPPPSVAEAADLARASQLGDGDDSRSRQAIDSAPIETPGQQIGHYRLIETIGEGGFGVVWEAEQLEPIRRRVALKLIKLGMDTRQVIARFEAERQALAVMAHPHIATVLDAGSTDTGRPYFVMELVRGIPILDYCSSNQLDTSSRLELFMKVCRAIHHAHQKGIIHRDIKPTNILVVVHDGEAIPKVIDFGIAKATEGDQGERTPITQHRQLMGTPAYMSPEQIGMEAGGVDIRSDVYSLGVLLYELLTESTPFDSTRQSKLGLPELIGIIREEEPLRPSACLDALGVKLSIVARRQRTVPSDLTHRVIGDLDWIIMRCLEKDRERRYGTASEIADDIQRHLKDEPVSAGPPSAAYRFTKFYHRHQAAVLLGGTVVASLFLFLAIGFAWTAWKNHELDASNAQLDGKNVELRLQKKSLENALADVERLSDARVLDKLEARAVRELWPALPHLIDPLSRWVEEAEDLLGRVARHRQKLETLKRGDQNQATTKDEWLHGLLSDLVTRLDAFADPKRGTLASVRRRLEFASRVQEETVGKFRAEWLATSESIRRSPLYRELADTGIEPQVGLIPLGDDPDSGLHEFLHLATHEGPIPQRDPSGKVALTEKTGVILVLLPGGRVNLGAQRDDPNAAQYDPQALVREVPIRRVEIEPFFISKYEMTQSQWLRISNGKNPSFYPAGISFGNRSLTGLHPVESVAWGECVRLTRRYDLKLPTDDQWEYAARGGTTSVWPCGDTVDSLRGFANLAIGTFEPRPESAASEEFEISDDFNVHSPVGHFRPNAFGLHDVCGNVQEWCTNLVTLSFKSTDVQKEHALRGRALRGGGHASRPDRARSAYRGVKLPGDPSPSTGLRPVRRLR